jgi:hypothetical protein
MPGLIDHARAIVRRSPFFRIVLLTLFAVSVLVLAVVMSRDRLSSTETEAIRSVERLGGQVKFSDQYDESGNPVDEAGRPVIGPCSPSEKPTWKERFAKKLKDWRCYEVRRIDLRGTRIVDADLQVLKDLPSVRTVELDQTGITDEGIRQLKDLKLLCYLGLQDTKVTEPGFNELRRSLPALRTNRSFQDDRGDELIRLIESTVGDSWDKEPLELKTDP